MFAVLITALATWATMVVLNALNPNNVLLEATIAVVVGAFVGLLVPWWRARRRRAAK